MMKIFKKFSTMFLLQSQVDELTSVQRLGRDTYKYMEGDHALMFDVEMQSGHPSNFIYEKSIRQWLPPHEHEEITPSDKERILRKIGSVFREQSLFL